MNKTNKLRYTGLAHQAVLTDKTEVSLTQQNVYSEYVRLLAQQVQQNETEALLPFFAAFRAAYAAYGKLYTTKIADF